MGGAASAGAANPVAESNRPGDFWSCQSGGVKAGTTRVAGSTPRRQGAAEGCAAGGEERAGGAERAVSRRALGRSRVAPTRGTQVLGEAWLPRCPSGWNLGVEPTHPLTLRPGVRRLAARSSRRTLPRPQGLPWRVAASAVPAVRGG